MLEMWTVTAAGAAVGEVPVNALCVQPAAAEQQTARCERAEGKPGLMRSIPQRLCQL